MMKKLLFTMMAGMLATIATAGHDHSVLNLRVFDNQQFIINLDGTKFHPPTLTKKITDLAPGDHYLKVVTVADVHTPQGPERVRTVIYDGNINVPACSRVSAKVGRHGNLRFLNVTAMHGNGGIGGNGNGYANGPGFGNGNGNAPGWGNGNAPGNGGSCGNPANSGPVGYTMNTNVHYTNGPGSGYGTLAPVGMAPGVFNNLAYTIGGMTFESDKMSVARSGIASNGVSAAQLAQLMALMTYESSKVELAKFGYNHTADRGNFFVVNNSLTYSSSVNELNSFVFASY